MLSPADDFPFHQTAEPFVVPDGEDRRWFDRYWFAMGDAAQGIGLITGIGTYPVTGRIDAYAMVSDGTTQHNIRVGRERSPDPRDLSAHGLSFELLEPMKRWRLRCEGREQVEFEIDFACTYPVNEMPKIYIERGDEVVMDMGHYAQAGAVSGFLRVGDRRLELDGRPGERDHSWGRRNPSGKVRSGMHVWVPCQVGDWAIWVWFRERASGERLALEGYVRHADGRSWKVVDYEHELEVAEYVPPHRQLVRGLLRLRLDDGQELELEAEPLAPVFLAGGGYVAGEKPQGSFEGDSYSTFSIADDGRAEIPATIIDHFSRFRLGGEEGQGVFELNVARYEPLGLDDPIEGAPA